METQMPNRAGSFTIQRKDSPNLQLFIDWTFEDGSTKWVQDGRKISVSWVLDRSHGASKDVSHIIVVDSTPVGIVAHTGDTMELWRAELVGGAHNGVVSSSPTQAVAILLSGVIPAKL